jgi:hypothetical protein
MRTLGPSSLRLSSITLISCLPTQVVEASISETVVLFQRLSGTRSLPIILYPGASTPRSWSRSTSRYMVGYAGECLGDEVGLVLDNLETGITSHPIAGPGLAALDAPLLGPPDLHLAALNYDAKGCILRSR